MNIINLTPHPISIMPHQFGELELDGMTIPPSGTVARVASKPGEKIFPPGDLPLYTAPTWGEVEGLPAEYHEFTIYLVSALVAARCVGRKDVFSPGTGPNDGAIRDAKGQIMAVTRLIQAPQ